MAIEFVQNATNSASNNTIQVSLAGVAVGNLLVLCIGKNTGLSSVTFSNGDIPTIALSYSSGSDSCQGVIYYAQNTSGGSVTATCNFSSVGGIAVSLSEYSGAATSGVLDGINTYAAGTASTTARTGSLTPTVDNCLLIAACTIGNTPGTVTPSGFIPLFAGQPNKYVIQRYDIQTTAAAAQLTVTYTNTKWAAGGIAAFKPAAGGDTTPPVVSSANVGTDGSTVTIDFTEADSQPILPATGVTGFALNDGTSDISITNLDRTGNTTLVGTASSIILASDTVTLKATSSNLTDSSSNALVDFSDQAVTNNSEAATPSNISPPTISGFPSLGMELSMTSGGSWNNAQSLSYQWIESDDGIGTNEADIAGQTTTEWTVDAPRIGKYIALDETATNAYGSTTVRSNYLGPVTNTPSITVTAPEAASQQIAGVAFNVDATVTDGSGSYNIEYSKNGGDTFALKASGQTLPYSLSLSDTDASADAVVRVIDSVNQAGSGDSGSFKVATNNPPTAGGTSRLVNGGLVQ